MGFYMGVFCLLLIASGAISSRIGICIKCCKQSLRFHCSDTETSTSNEISCTSTCTVLKKNRPCSKRVLLEAQNCGQCKQMFGHYFHGQACAESCLASKGSTSPDCNNPVTLRGLILRLY